MHKGKAISDFSQYQVRILSGNKQLDLDGKFLELVSKGINKAIEEANKSAAGEVSADGCFIRDS
ncbi:MAG: hypothetical protein PHU23_04575 [Dehalococcoidales bacterium]|nr:hypothetical protein [Dehalococcoidales bacterium]